MTRAAWSDIATALGELRAKLLTRAERSKRQKNRQSHLERAIGVELAARAVCYAIRARSTRFDSRRFMRLVATAAK